MYKEKEFNLKNQNFITEGHKNDCTIYTMFTILELNYLYLFSYARIELISKHAVIDKVLTSLWARFNSIYTRFTDVIDPHLKSSLNIKINHITNPSFKKDVNNWLYYWIGFRYTNWYYLEMIKKGKLGKKDIDLIIKWKKGSGHNNVFWKNIDRNVRNSHTIYEIYTWQEIACSLETLMYWVEKWLLYNTCRSLVFADRNLHKWARLIKENDGEPVTAEAAKKFNFSAKAYYKKAWDIYKKYN